MAVTGVELHDKLPASRAAAGVLQVQQYIMVTADHHHLDDDCDVLVDADLSILVGGRGPQHQGWQAAAFGDTAGVVEMMLGMVATARLLPSAGRSVGGGMEVAWEALGCAA